IPAADCKLEPGCCWDHRASLPEPNRFPLTGGSKTHWSGWLQMCRPAERLPAWIHGLAPENPRNRIGARRGVPLAEALKDVLAVPLAVVDEKSPSAADPILDLSVAADCHGQHGKPSIQSP